MDTNRDGDNNFSTASKGDRGGMFYAVSNDSDVTQTVHVTVVLDAPGTEFDRTIVDEDAVMAPGDIEQNHFDFKITVKWPKGTYSLSVTGSGTESATAVSTFTVN